MCEVLVINDTIRLKELTKNGEKGSIQSLFRDLILDVHGIMGCTRTTERDDLG
jgi:hypothetical protein